MGLLTVIAGVGISVLAYHLRSTGHTLPSAGRVCSVLGMAWLMFMVVPAWIVWDSGARKNE